MNHDELLATGAFALYRCGQACRIREFETSGDSEALIARDCGARVPRHR